METVHFPPCDDIAEDSRVKIMTKQLLSNMDKGLFLECKDGDIYATRLCR